MKEVICLCCGERWMVEEENIAKMKVCTFCGIPVVTYEAESVKDEFAQLLYEIVNAYGTDIITSGHLSAYMFDMRPKRAKEIKIFVKAFTDDYLRILQRSFEDKSYSVETDMQKIKNNLLGDAMSDEWACKFVTSCELAVKTYRGERKRAKINVKIHDYEDRDSIELQNCKEELKLYRELTDNSEKLIEASKRVIAINEKGKDNLGKYIDGYERIIHILLKELSRIELLKELPKAERLIIGDLRFQMQSMLRSMETQIDQNA